MKTPRTPRTRRGVALMMALVVVLLATTYISEFFVTSGLELRSLQTFRDADTARGMARLAFKALQTGLVASQAEVMRGVADLQAGAGLLAIPWQGGLLTELRVEPMDHLYNLNELASLQQEGAQGIARRELFRRILTQVQTLPEQTGLPVGQVTDEMALGYYGALVDWMDKDEKDYVGPLAVGAEQSAYLGRDPEFTVPNTELEQLTEIRLVRGISESRIPWGAWETRFSALPVGKKTLYPGKLNVNYASAAQIRAFLEDRLMNDPSILPDSISQELQKGINAFADHADDVVALVIPENQERPTLDDKEFKQRLAQIQDLAAYKTVPDQLFSTKTQFFRVAITAEMNGVEAHLRAVLNLPSGGKGGGTVTVVRFSLK